MKHEAIVISLFAGLLATSNAAISAVAPRPACSPVSDDYYEKLFASPLPVVSVSSSPSPVLASGGEPQVVCPDPSLAPCPQAGPMSGLAAQVAAQVPETVPPECIRTLMNRRPKESRLYLYAQCGGEEDVATTACVPAPQITDAYVDFTRKAFIGAFQCLGEDPREFVGLIGNEAAFQINLGNTSHAWGVAQITAHAGAPEVFGHWFDKFREKPECATYSSIMTLDGIKKSTPCLLTSVPANPARSFLIAGMLFQRLRSEAALLVPKGVGGADRRQMIRDLATEMYNAGDGGIIGCWRNYLADHPGGASNYAVFKAGFSKYLSGHYLEGIHRFDAHPEARERARVEVSRYVAGVRSTGAFANRANKDCAR